MTRHAVVTGWSLSDPAQAMHVTARYLPENYRAVGIVHLGLAGLAVEVEGVDVAGWTLEGYVIPRLASGGYACREVSGDGAAQ